VQAGYGDVVVLVHLEGTGLHIDGDELVKP
jgi:hypothetical protein